MEWQETSRDMVETRDHRYLLITSNTVFGPHATGDWSTYTTEERQISSLERSPIRSQSRSTPRIDTRHTSYMERRHRQQT